MRGLLFAVAVAFFVAVSATKDDKQETEQQKPPPLCSQGLKSPLLDSGPYAKSYGAYRLCCAEKCGSCTTDGVGFKGCGKRPGGGDECCAKNIVANRRVCEGSDDTGCLLGQENMDDEELKMEKEKTHGNALDILAHLPSRLFKKTKPKKERNDDPTLEWPSPASEKPLPLPPLPAAAVGSFCATLAQFRPSWDDLIATVTVHTVGECCDVCHATADCVEWVVDRARKPWKCCESLTDTCFHPLIARPPTAKPPHCLTD